MYNKSDSKLFAYITSQYNCIAAYDDGTQQSHYDGIDLNTNTNLKYGVDMPTPFTDDI